MSLEKYLQKIRQENADKQAVNSLLDQYGKPIKELMVEFFSARGFSLDSKSQTNESLHFINEELNIKVSCHFKRTTKLQIQVLLDGHEIGAIDVTRPSDYEGLQFKHDHKEVFLPGMGTVHNQAYPLGKAMDSVFSNLS